MKILRDRTWRFCLMSFGSSLLGFCLVAAGGQNYFYSRFEDKSGNTLNETVCQVKTGEDPQTWDIQEKLKEKTCYQRVYLPGKKSKKNFSFQGNRELDPEVLRLRSEAKNTEKLPDGTARITNWPKR